MIKLFEQEHGEPLAEFEQRVNEWAKTVDVVSVTNSSPDLRLWSRYTHSVSDNGTLQLNKQKDRSQYERFLMVTHEHVKAYIQELLYHTMAILPRPYFIKKESRHKVLSYVTHAFSRFLAGVMAE